MILLRALLTFPLTILRDLRAGRALRRLHDAKRARGIDWCAHSSWASDHPLIVVLVRAPGVKAAVVAAPLVQITGDVGAALARASEAVS